MDPTLLAGIRRLDDLRRLVGAVGHPAAWTELDPAMLPVQVERAAYCGCAGSFEWLAVAVTAPEIIARRLSTALAARGRQVGVLALDQHARLLAIGVTAGTPATVCIHLDRPDRAGLACLRRLTQAGELSGYAFASRAREALTIEEVGRRFFTGFRLALEEMAGTIAPGAAARDRTTLALLQLVRVLFLYFVQARGWLDGQPDFLRNWLDRTLVRRRRLHRDLFRPLFFGTLNRRPEARGRARAFGRVPFLNGGLFEPHPLERHWRPEIPDSCWRSVFDDLFERFHFTLDPMGRAGAIAPDMLGHVFEQLMAPYERRRTGAFYTPAALVERTVELALECWVAARLEASPDEARALLARREPRALDLLRTVTILDPAAGSGAFLLGTLERLADLRRDEAPPSAVRRRILEENLFGVDQNPMAVTLAELRLWLAVIAADDSTDPARIQPLPNLDGVVRQGDTLLDPAHLLARLGVHPEAAGLGLRSLRTAFMRATGSAKQDHLRQLRRAERQVLRLCLASADERLEREIVRTLDDARAPSLFGEPRGLGGGGARRLRTLRAQRGELRRMGRRLEREGEVPWFSFEAQFGDVLARGGFDCVLGNPPWVRAEQLPARTRTLLAERFRWWRTCGRGFRHQPDIALAFVERGLELMRPGGVLAYLLPVKIATADYARLSRRALAEEHTLHLVADLTNVPEARFAAVTYPALLVLGKGPAPPRHRVRFSVQADSTLAWPQQVLAGGAPWPLGQPAVLDAVARVRAGHPTVGERFAPQLGVKTGANDLFLDPPPDLEPVVIRTALRGRDLEPHRVRGGARLFYPHGGDGLPLQRLPPAAMRHVRRHHVLLQSRVDYQGGPTWTLFRVHGAMGAFRVVWPDLARTLSAVALTAAHEALLVPLNTCYVVRTRDRDAALALCAWLNCTWIRVAARTAADRAASGFSRFNARVVRDLPLPPGVLSDPELISLALAGARGAPIQSPLDERCAGHLALPSECREVLRRADDPLANDRR